MILKIKKIEEAGYMSAMLGLALNKKQNKNMHNVAVNLSKMNGGHNKFMEHMITWFEVEAPRYWWSEADTYRLSSKQSESTMHTLIKDLNDNSNNIKRLFEDRCLTYPQEVKMKVILDDKSLSETEKLIELKQMIPEGFLQKREWCLSYKTIKNIIEQRKTHRLPHWKVFIDEVLKQVDHPEFLTCI
jgi:hypothetical protein